jgi:hypothetical protein
MVTRAWSEESCLKFLTKVQALRVIIIIIIIIIVIIIITNLEGDDIEAGGGRARDVLYPDLTLLRPLTDKTRP